MGTTRGRLKYYLQTFTRFLSIQGRGQYASRLNYLLRFLFLRQVLHTRLIPLPIGCCDWHGHNPKENKKENQRLQASIYLFIYICNTTKLKVL